MELCICASSFQQEVLEKKGLGTGDIVWVDDISSFRDHISADAFFDLRFEESYDVQRLATLQQLNPKPVFINSVLYTLSELRASENIIRINAWATFLERSIMELSCLPASVPVVNTIMKALGWQYHLLPDIAGFYSARIISSIINEAYHTLGEEVSSKEEIDIAMKLGTSYPYGPFEWAGKIGAGNILSLLQILSSGNTRYAPAPSLVKELATT